MVHHIAMMKFKTGITDEQIDGLVSMLDELPNKIIEIHLYEFGRDMLNTDRSYDFALVALFANVQALERYQKHPAHLKVLEKIETLCDDIKTVDFEDQGFKQGGRDQNPLAADPFKRLVS